MPCSPSSPLSCSTQADCRTTTSPDVSLEMDYLLVERQALMTGIEVWELENDLGLAPNVPDFIL